jgi:tyrosyl-tRNA synthetase
MTLSEELTWRGFVNQTTFTNIKELDEHPRTFYWGVDPSASSMTIGHFAAAMMVKIFIKHGYTPILLVGGATGLIGDPDGKKQERDLKSSEEISKNKQAIVSQYKRIFDGQDFKLVDNYDWFKDVGYLEFLREVGKHVPMRIMLGREFVQSRLKDDGSGISYAEFSYSLIQGYDFLHLFKEYGVTLQLAGADQWGNSIAGVDLIRRKTGKEAHVWTFPLIINKETGVKFGKSEAGAIWLDSTLTTPYQFYQFWLNVDDDSVSDYLKIYTQIEKASFETLMSEFSADKASRKAQKLLAYEVTKQVHGTETADSIARITDVLFGSHNYSSLQQNDFKELLKELPVAKINLGDSLVKVLVDTGLAGSNSEARRFIEQGAVYINGNQVIEETVLEQSHLLAQEFVILRRGKNSNAILRVTS